mmetsp:Transcript_4588/g.8775  ORF Transcript_4588/g.8775 Transcript_4588/m.8775 type:complete len:446 (+) Transcript_4588:1541-2878(+)
MAESSRHHVAETQLSANAGNQQHRVRGQKNDKRWLRRNSKGSQDRAKPKLIQSHHPVRRAGGNEVQVGALCGARDVLFRVLHATRARVVDVEFVNVADNCLVPGRRDDLFSAVAVQKFSDFSGVAVQLFHVRAIIVVIHLDLSLMIPKNYAPLSPVQTRRCDNRIRNPTIYSVQTPSQSVPNFDAVSRASDNREFERIKFCKLDRVVICELIFCSCHPLKTKQGCGTHNQFCSVGTSEGSDRRVLDPVGYRKCLNTPEGSKVVTAEHTSVVTYHHVSRSWNDFNPHTVGVGSWRNKLEDWSFDDRVPNQNEIVQASRDEKVDISTIRQRYYPLLVASQDKLLLPSGQVPRTHGQVQRAGGQERRVHCIAGDKVHDNVRVPFHEVFGLCSLQTPGSDHSSSVSCDQCVVDPSHTNLAELSGPLHCQVHLVAFRVPEADSLIFGSGD